MNKDKPHVLIIKIPFGNKSIAERALIKLNRSAFFHVLAKDVEIKRDWR